MHRLSGNSQLRAGVIANGSVAKGELIAIMPLADATLRTTSVSLLEIPQ